MNIHRFYGNERACQAGKQVPEAEEWRRQLCVIGLRGYEVEVCSARAGFGTARKTGGKQVRVIEATITLGFRSIPRERALLLRRR